MALRKTEYLNEIFRLLSEQRELLKHLPYSSEQIRKDKEISARIRELVDQISEPSPQPETWQESINRKSVKVASRDMK